jgi:hypothetical protein
MVHSDVQDSRNSLVSQTGCNISVQLMFSRSRR